MPFTTRLRRTFLKLGLQERLDPPQPKGKARETANAVRLTRMPLLTLIGLLVGHPELQEQEAHLARRQAPDQVAGVGMLSGAGPAFWTFCRASSQARSWWMLAAATAGTF